MDADSTMAAAQLKFTAVTRLASGHIRLQGRGAAGNSYSVQASTNLVGGSFAWLGPVTADATGAIDYDDATAGGPSRRFYRLSYP